MCNILTEINRCSQSATSFPHFWFIYFLSADAVIGKAGFTPTGTLNRSIFKVVLIVLAGKTRCESRRHFCDLNSLLKTAKHTKWQFNSINLQNCMRKKLSRRKTLKLKLLDPCNDLTYIRRGSRQKSVNRSTRPVCFGFKCCEEITALTLEHQLEKSPSN